MSYAENLTPSERAALHSAYEAMEDWYTPITPDEIRDLRLLAARDHGRGDRRMTVTMRELVGLLRLADPPGVPIEDLVNNLLTSIAPAPVLTPSKVAPSAMPHLAAGDAALARGDYGAAADAIDRATVEIRRGGA